MMIVMTVTTVINKCLYLNLPESLDELETMTVELFSDVRNKNLTAPTWPLHPFGPEQLQMKGYIIPIKDLRNLNITFPIPDLHEYYKAGVSHCRCSSMRI
jgi:insulysin